MNKRRRSLTPSTGLPNVQPSAQARRGGARQTVSDRVTFHGETGGIRAGWALNVSLGGIRAILDEDTGKVELGEEYAISVGEADPRTARKGRIVWLQEEPDGFVVGVEYVSPSGTHRAAPASGPPFSRVGASEEAENAAVEASGVSPAARAHSGGAHPEGTDPPPDED